MLALLREHQPREATGLHLVSVLDSDLDQNHEIYHAALRRFGGTYIPVDRMSAPRAEGTLDTGLSAVIQEVFRLSAFRLDVSFVQEGDEVVARRSDGIDATNESERLILSFLAVLFAAELSDYPIVAISWTEARLESLARETLWRLVRTQLGVRRSGLLRTLAIIAGGRADPPLHCEHEVSVRFALTEMGLSKRKSRISLAADVGKLVREPERPFVLFLGAGASVSSRMPLGNEARDYALERFFASQPSLPITDLALRFHQWVKENGRLLADEDALDTSAFAERLTLERVLREELRRDGRERSPTLVHLAERNRSALELKKTRTRRALRSILGRPNRVVIVTVNFDTILEDEFPEGLAVFATPADFVSADNYLTRYLRDGGLVPVLKLHGTLNQPSSIVADVDTRSLGLSHGAVEALQRLRGETTRPTPWVYVGASMRDPDVTEVIGAGDFADRLDEWWVSPFPDPAVAAFAEQHRIPRWQNAKRPGLFERQITETADTFLTSLAASWPVGTPARLPHNDQAL